MNIEITPQILKEIFPTITRTNAEKYINSLNLWMQIHGISDTVDRAAAFIAQIGHESGAFHYVQEIASGRAYEGRKDLGNTQKGDGVRFKGRGLIQITGRANYQQLDHDFQLDGALLNNPALLETSHYAVRSAVWYWSNRGLNEIADHSEEWTTWWKGQQYNKFQWITIKINGGLNGYTDRLRYYEQARKTLNP